MIETILIICALTLEAPFYDCSEQWTIEIHDSLFLQDPNGYWVTGYADYKNNVIGIGTARMDSCWDGRCLPLLWHELKHLQCDCNWHEKLKPTRDIWKDSAGWKHTSE